MLVLYRLKLKKQSSGVQICQIKWTEGSWRRITLFCDIGDVRGDVKYCQECLCCWTIQNNNTNKNCYLCNGVFQQPSCSSPQQRWVMKWDSLEVSVIISLQYETCMLRPCKWHGTRKELEVPCTTPQCQFQLQAHRCCNTPGNVPGRLTPRTGLRSHHTHTHHLHGVMELSAEQLIVGETIWRPPSWHLQQQPAVSTAGTTV